MLCNEIIFKSLSKKTIEEIREERVIHIEVRTCFYL